MSTLRENLKRITPAPLWKFAGQTCDALDQAKEFPAATFHPWRRDTINRLRQLKDIHQGERCFIIGNGPSLKQTDLSHLLREYTIGMNRFYLAYPELGFTNTYYLSINDLVVEQCAADIQSLPLQKFVSWRAHKWLSPAQNLYYLYTTYTAPKFSQDITGRLWEGATVTYVAMQLAFYLGFRQVILIGVDHGYISKGKPNTTIVSDGDDPNHFDPQYFGKGFRWQLPDLDTSQRSYEMARQAYQAAGREIIDATVGGNLRVFPRVDYEKLF